MRSAFIFFILLVFTGKISAQQDYFYAENLYHQGKYAEAVKVLDHLTANGAYADRPRFAMMTLNLTGTCKLYLNDTTGAQHAFVTAMNCYDSLTPPRKADDWNRREYYKAGFELAEMYCLQNKFTEANSILVEIQRPGHYYSATGSDVLVAQDKYCLLRARVFEFLNKPDSAFKFIRQVRELQWQPAKLDSIFDIKSNYITQVECVKYKGKNILNKSTGDFLFFVAWSGEANFQNSIWFTHPESEPVEIIGKSTYNEENDSGFPANCYRMSLSPDEKFLAVECYTEGSNNIDIFSFPEIISDKKCIGKHSILAYPSNVEIIGWENTMLIVESDADLTRYNKKQRINFDVTENPDLKHQFLFDVESGKFSRK